MPNFFTLKTIPIVSQGKNGDFAGAYRTAKDAQTFLLRANLNEASLI